MPRHLLSIATAIAVILSALPACASPAVLLKETFDGPAKPGSLAQKLLAHAKIRLAPKAGPDGSDAIRVSYVGSPEGSERVVVRHPLASHAQEAELSFDVCFEEDFQWTGGGKLHGLGPAHPVTGGNPRSPQKWSVRAVFRPEGAVATYIYDQTPDTKYGKGQKSDGPVFQKGRWHHVQLRTRVNAPGHSDGFAHISVDERVVIEQEGVELRGMGGPETDIQTFLFSTFHGGNGTKWTPVDPDGKPATVHALFDNFEVVGFADGDASFGKHRSMSQTPSAAHD